MGVFCPLASGSKGNALYLEGCGTKVLIDAGISFKVLQKKLSSIDVDIGEIEAILVTHEHGDHTKGLEHTANKLGIPLLSNGETAKAIIKQMNSTPRFKIFTTGESFEFGALQVTPFSVQHDTLDPVGFTFTIGSYKIGVCADLGFVSSLVKLQLKDCNILYLEFNHEVSMVHSSNRPSIYKQRVLGRQGHLSNESASLLLKDIDHSGLEHIYLAHLSSECNSPHVALKQAQDHCERQLPLSIAYQDTVSTPFYF